MESLHFGICRCHSINETAALALSGLYEIRRRQPSIATLRREIDDIVRCAPNALKLSLPHAAHCSGGSATSRTPLAAVAARGAVENVNDLNCGLVKIFLEC